MVDACWASTWTRPDAPMNCMVARSLLTWVIAKTNGNGLLAYVKTPPGAGASKCTYMFGCGMDDGQGPTHQ